MRSRESWASTACLVTCWACGLSGGSSGATSSVTTFQSPGLPCPVTVLRNPAGPCLRRRSRRNQMSAPPPPRFPPAPRTERRPMPCQSTRTGHPRKQPPVKLMSHRSGGYHSRSRGEILKEEAPRRSRCWVQGGDVQRHESSVGVARQELAIEPSQGGDVLRKPPGGANRPGLIQDAEPAAPIGHGDLDRPLPRPVLPAGPEGPPPGRRRGLRARPRDRVERPGSCIPQRQPRGLTGFCRPGEPG